MTIAIPIIIESTTVLSDIAGERINVMPAKIPKEVMLLPLASFLVLVATTCRKGTCGTTMRCSIGGPPR